MKSGTLLFGVAVMVALVPASALATSTPTYPKPTCMLSANPGAVEAGRTTNLSWTSQYATQGYITSIGTVGTAGKQGVIPTGRGTTYVGTFTGPGGTGQCSITVYTIEPSGAWNGGGVEGGGTVEGPGSVNPTGGIGTPGKVDEPGSAGVLYPGSVGSPGTVSPPDRLPSSQGSAPPTTLPPANDITLSNTKSNGLVPCTGTDCQACHLASLAQRIINFLLGLSIPLAAAMFAWAGVVYFTAVTTNSVDKAHKIFKSVGIGFGIVLCAWLGVNTVLKTILNPNMFKEGTWFTIQCVNPKDRPTNKTIGELLSVLPGLNTLTPAPTPTSQNYGGQINPSTGCADGDYFSGGVCTNAFGGTYKPSSTANCDPELGCFTPAANTNIGDAARNYQERDTSMGPDNGNLACAWAVNQVLQDAGVQPIDNNLVYNMEQQLNAGRGTPIDTADARKGDIVVWKTDTVSHVGICYDENCSQVISNSSGNRAFNNFSGTTFLGVPGRIYRVNR